MLIIGRSPGTSKTSTLFYPAILLTLTFGGKIIVESLFRLMCGSGILLAMGDRQHKQMQE